MRKVLVFLAAILLTAALSVAGTMATYYTLNPAQPQGNSISHVMNGGNDMLLMPAYEKSPGGAYDWKSAGTLDKHITVENNGSSACYFRVVLGFEDNGSMFSSGAILTDLMKANGGSWDIQQIDGTVTVGGDPYVVFVITAQEQLNGKASVQIPMNVAMRSYVTGQDIAPLDGSYTVLSVAQALWMDESLKDKIALDGTYTGGMQYDYEAADFGPAMLSELLGSDYAAILTTCLNNNQ